MSKPRLLLLVVLLLASLGAIGAWRAGRGYVQSIAVSQLESHGLGPVALTVADIGLGGVTVSGLSLLDGAASAERVTLGIGLSGVLHGRLEGISLKGAALPFGVTAQVEREGSHARFTATLLGQNTPLRLEITGEHDLAQNQGEARLEMTPLTFDPTGFQPADLLPRLSEFIQGAAGSVSMSGDLAWDASGVTPDLDLVFEDLSFTHGFLGVQRLNGVVKLNGLSPLSTPPAQQLAVAVLQAGVPLTDAVVSFGVKDGATLVVDSGRLYLAGGELTLERETIPLDGSPIQMTLQVKDIGLAEVTALTEMKGLSATGTLSGSVPATLAAGDLHIHHAVLTNNGPGVLIYRPPGGAPSGAGVADIAWQALDNFHYTKLQARLDGRTSGEMALTLNLAGSNPEVYGGYPLELNLNVEGRLAEVLSQGLRGYQIPDKIQKSMENALSKKSR